MTSFAGKRILVVGLGESGHSTAAALLGLDAKVRVTESRSDARIEERASALRARGAEVETGGHDLMRLDADLAVVSPGIAPHADVIRALRREGVEMIGEIELAFMLAPCPIVAVTGTNGKTTTTSLIAAMLTESGIPSAAAGNIGWPLIDAVEKMPPDGVLAAEVSSFQLALIERFRPHVAVLLNVAEDHTDWHGSVADYAAAKARITENQTREDFFVPNADDAIAMEVASAAAASVVPFSAARVPPGGIGPAAGVLKSEDQDIVALEDVPLVGAAGVEDVAAAAAASLCAGAGVRAVERAIKGFRPLPHRMQVVAEVDGVTYIDDSKATNPHATLTAVRGLKDVVLIAGGRSKGIDLSALRRTVPPVVSVVALGEARERVAELFEDLVPVDVVDTMRDAAVAASRRSVRGGSVLLSPGCASLDMYESYAARGEDFARAVGELLKSDGDGHGDR